MTSDTHSARLHTRSDVVYVLSEQAWKTGPQTTSLDGSSNLFVVLRKLAETSSQNVVGLPSAEQTQDKPETETPTSTSTSTLLRQRRFPGKAASEKEGQKYQSNEGRKKSEMSLERHEDDVNEESSVDPHRWQNVFYFFFL